MAELPHGPVRVPEHVASRSFGGRTVLLNLRTGQYHGLNATGGRMLEALDAAGSAAGVPAMLAAEYGRPEEEIAADLAELCEKLAARGLLEVDAADPG
jgi:hypothetical protein